MLHALASEALPRRADVDPRWAWPGGLRRTLGVPVLERLARDRQPAPEIFDRARYPGYLEWENVSFGLSNSEVTTTAGGGGRLSPERVNAFQEHRWVRDVG